MIPLCPFCKKTLIASNIGYKLEDMSMAHPDLRFVEIFYCKQCNSTLTINKALKEDLRK